MRLSRRSLLKAAARLGVAVVVALIAIALPTLASADEPEASETVATVLEPGNNFVGWIGDYTPVEDILEQVPEIEVVYTWHADWRTWLMAAPSLPKSLWTLRYVAPGSALIMRLRGDEPVEWARPNAPVRNKVELFEGTNWVSWSGPDNTDIERIVKGIGKALTSIRFGDHVYEPIHPAAAATWPLIQQGDVLQVTVSRRVNWLQPTGIIPPITFEDVENRLNTAEFITSIGHVTALSLRFYEEVFGIQPQVDKIEIAELGLTELGVLPAGDFTGGRNRIRLSSAHLADLKPNRLCEVASVLVHEYFHAAQFHLPSVLRAEPYFFSEGWASWVEDIFYDSIDQGHFRTVCDNAKEPSDLAVLTDVEFAASLPLTEWIQHYEVATKWILPQAYTPLDSYRFAQRSFDYYFIGYLAAHWLAMHGGLDSPIEFYRSLGRDFGFLATRDFGAGEVTFAEEFGISIDDFYAAFDAFLIAEGLYVEEYESFSGTARWADGTPMANAWIVPYREDSFGGQRFPAVRTDGAGNFRYTLWLPRGQRYGIEVVVASDTSICSGWFAESGSGLFGDADSVLLPEDQLVLVDLVMPNWLCRIRIHGSMSDNTGHPSANALIMQVGNPFSEARGSAYAVTDELGKFELIGHHRENYQRDDHLDEEWREYRLIATVPIERFDLDCEVRFTNVDISELDGGENGRGVRPDAKVRLEVPGAACDVRHILKGRVEGDVSIQAGLDPIPHFGFEICGRRTDLRDICESHYEREVYPGGVFMTELTGFAEITSIGFTMFRKDGGYTCNVSIYPEIDLIADTGQTRVIDLGDLPPSEFVRAGAACGW